MIRAMHTKACTAEQPKRYISTLHVLYSTHWLEEFIQVRKYCESSDLVTIQAGHAALRYVCGVPIALEFADEWPQYSPGEDRAEEGGEVDMVRADHPGTDVRHAEIEEEPDRKHSRQTAGFRLQRG